MERFTDKECACETTIRDITKKGETNMKEALEGTAEMEATIDRLRKEIQQLIEERDALEQGNLALYRKLTELDF